jgi:uncharacterized protein (TIRG00374 family)
MSDTSLPAPSRRGRVLLLVFGIASSAFFLWLVFHDANLHDVWRALSGADAGLVVLAAVVMQAVYVLQGARWRIIADTLQLGVPRFYALVLAGLAANNVLPLRIGDLLRARWLGTSAGIPAGRALGSVFRDRVCDVIVLVVALVVALPFVGDELWVERIAIGGVFLLILLAIVAVGAIVYARSRPRERRASRGRVRRFVRDTIDELASPIARRHIVVALALSVVAWGIWAAAAGIVCRSLGFSLSPVELVFVTAVVNLGVAIPSSPGFVGTYQWLAVSALRIVGVEGEVAIAFSILMQAIWYIPTTLAGGVIALREVHREAVRVREPAEAGVPSPP